MELRPTGFRRSLIRGMDKIRLLNWWVNCHEPRGLASSFRTAADGLFLRLSVRGGTGKRPVPEVAVPGRCHPAKKAGAIPGPSPRWARRSRSAQPYHFQVTPRITG